MNATASVLGAAAASEVGRARRRYADVEQMTLSVRYDFPSTEMRRAEAGADDEEAQAVRRIVRHETLHLYQLATTPYGMYLAQLADAQAALTRVVIETLRERGLKVKFPLGRYVDGLPGLDDSDPVMAVGTRVQNWRGLDAAMLFLEGSGGALARAGRRIGASRALSAEELLNASDRVLFEFVAFMEERAPGGYWPATVAPRPVVFPSGQEDQARLRLYSAMRMFAPFDAMAVLEHTAKIAEYWGSRDERPAREAFRIGKNVRYSSLATLTLSRLGNMRLLEFVPSVLAIGELALFAPMLPSQHRFRRSDMTLLDIDPLARFDAALRVAAEMPNVRETGVADYHAAICDRLGWPTPAEIATAGAQAPEPSHNPVLSRYRWAQEFRARAPFAFLDFSVWSTPKNATVNAFRALFSHPVMEFSDDRKWIHKDRATVHALQLRFLHHKYLRRVMMSRDLSLSLPISLSDDEVQMLAGALREMLSGTIRDPRIQITAFTPARTAAGSLTDGAAV